MIVAGRGCGSMSHDALYHYWPISDKGTIPLETLIVDPVRAIDRQKANIAAQGITVMKAPGRGSYDLFDLVGKTHYLYKADFWMEGCLLSGFSRKIPRNTTFNMLDKGSLHWLLHDRGALTSASAERLLQHVNQGQTPCQKQLQEHALPLPGDMRDTCSAMWFHEIHEDDAVEQSPGRWWRSPTKKYGYLCEPIDWIPDYVTGIFMVLPLSAGVFVGTTIANSDGLSKMTGDALDELSKLGFTCTQVNLNDQDSYSSI